MVPQPCWTRLSSVESLFRGVEELPSYTQETQGTLLVMLAYQMIVDCEIVTLLRPCSVSCGGYPGHSGRAGSFWGHTQQCPRISGTVPGNAQETLWCKVLNTGDTVCGAYVP